MGLLGACGSDSEEPAGSGANGTENTDGLRDVVHLVDHFDEVLVADGPLRDPLIPDRVLWPLKDGRDLEDGLSCHELPWPALSMAGVVVTEGDDTRKPVLVRADLDEQHFVFVPAVRRIDADSVVEARIDPEVEPTELRRRRNSVHQASQVLFRDGQRGEVPVELTGESVTIRVRARPEAATRCRLLVLLDGEIVGETRFRQRPFEIFEWDVGPRSGATRLQVQAEWDGDEPQAPKFLFAVQWLEVVSGTSDRVLVKEPGTEALVEYAPRAPAAVETLSGEPRTQWFAPIIGGPVEIEASASLTAATFRNGTSEQSVDFPPELGNTAELQMSAGLVHLTFEQPVGKVIVRQGRAGLLPFLLNDDLRLDDDLSPTLHSNPSLEEAATWICSRLEMDGDRRASLFLPTPSRLTMNVEWRAGDRFRFALGRAAPPIQWQLDHDGGDEGPVMAARAELAFVTAEGTRVPLGTWTDTGEARWVDHEIVVPSAADGAGTLEFETSCDTSWACVPMAFADPRIVPPVDQIRPRTNLLLYLVDTLRADRLQCYDGPNPTSPTLDRIAEQGFLFENFRAVASWTRPTTATAMTGLFPSYHGILADDCALPKGLVTLAEVLRAAGYSTWAGVTNIQVSAPGVHFEQGFHRFATPQSFGITNPQIQTEPSSRLLGQGMLPWLKAYQDEPFFLYLHSMDPHIPYLPPEDFKDRYTGDYDGVYHGTDLVGVADLWQPVLQLASRPEPGSLQPDDVEYLRQIYDAEIRCQDDELAAVEETLRDGGRWNDTVWVIFSDHGEEFFEHQKFTHAGRMWEELLHVPLVMHVPAPVQRDLGLVPSRVRPPVSQVDLFPSLLELLSVDSTVLHQGESFLPWMRGEEPEERRTVYSHENENLGSLVHGDYKLIWRPVESDPDQLEWLLFRLDLDPDEQNNLAEREADRLAQMRGLKSAVEATQSKGGALIPQRADSISFDDATIEHLKALGYLDD